MKQARTVGKPLTKNVYSLSEALEFLDGGTTPGDSNRTPKLRNEAPYGNDKLHNIYYRK